MLFGIVCSCLIDHVLSGMFHPKSLCRYGKCVRHSHDNVAFMATFYGPTVVVVSRGPRRGRLIISVIDYNLLWIVAAVRILTLTDS